VALTAVGRCRPGTSVGRFWRVYGESLYGCLMARRIERAMALLRRSELSVTAVCFAVGCSLLGTSAVATHGGIPAVTRAAWSR
jgi:methylphosphotriester-DNA--protein-cysteine methyltransferase